jgi:hypothetical protein
LSRLPILPILEPCSSTGADFIYLLLYIDDIVLTAMSPELLQRTTTALQQQFVMKDLSPLHHFISISVEQRFDGFSSTSASMLETSLSVLA